MSIIQQEASIGLMLGHVSLQSKNKGLTYRFKFEWSNKHLPYINHVYKKIDEWEISKPHEKPRVSPKYNVVSNWGFQTISHETFNHLAVLFKDGKKATKNLICFHLTSIGLAYWFMDDGGKLDYNQLKNKSIVLNTMSEELENKFNLGCKVRFNKGKKIIVINNDEFIFYQKKYIIPEIKFKLARQ